MMNPTATSYRVMHQALRLNNAAAAQIQCGNYTRALSLLSSGIQLSKALLVSSHDDTFTLSSNESRRKCTLPHQLNISQPQFSQPIFDEDGFLDQPTSFPSGNQHFTALSVWQRPLKLSENFMECDTRSTSAALPILSHEMVTVFTYAMVYNLALCRQLQGIWYLSSGGTDTSHGTSAVSMHYRHQRAALGLYQNACKLLQTSLFIDDQAKHLHSIVMMNNMSCLHQRLGDTVAAISCQQRILQEIINVRRFLSSLQPRLDESGSDLNTEIQRLQGEACITSNRHTAVTTTIPLDRFWWQSIWLLLLGPTCFAASAA